MIRICKNFTPTVNAKRSSITIKDDDTSKRIFDILHDLNILYRKHKSFKSLVIVRKYKRRVKR